MKYERELFKFSDGGTIALDWVDFKPQKVINNNESG
jgi:predicted alpha/beta-fold hydrolase